VHAMDDGQPGIYGTQCTASPSNIPGGRWGAVAWTDANGKFWLFGGDAVDARGLRADMNDLWSFDPGTKEWTWMGGSDTALNTEGSYGTINSPAATNLPPGRVGSVSWIDQQGNLWLFGGNGYDPTGALGIFNDLWEFSTTSGMWTWVSGSSTVGPNGGQSATYGTQGTPAAGNVPGGHVFATSWRDSSGNFWFFGGDSYTTVPAPYAIEYYPSNELWEFNPGSKSWAWMGGSQTPGSSGGQAGTYGNLGQPSTAAVPGSRANAAGWIGTDGNFWMFGGSGVDANGKKGALNDLWRYAP
jgi:hypothetical protein